MKGFGFTTAVVATPFTQADAEVTSPSARAWGLVDEGVASKYGYHTGLTPAFVAQQKENDAFRAATAKNAPSSAAERDAESRVFLGQDTSGNLVHDPSIPKGGCAGEASRELGVLQEDQLVINLEIDASNKALADPAVVKVFGAWSRCMSSRGFDYKTPEDANSDPTWNVDAPNSKPSSQELATAVADVQCKAQTKVVPVWSGVLIATQKDEVDKNAQELASVLKKEKAVMAKAAQVVSDSGFAG